MKATLITDIQSTELTDVERDWLKNPLLGGIILFTRHFESKAQLKSLVAEIQSINQNLIITVDHEGGRVQRFRDDFSQVAAMGKIGELYKNDKSLALQAAYSSAIVLAFELLEVGIDLTYAPVLDINYMRNSVIGDRAFSDNEEDIEAIAKSFIDGLNKMQFAVVAKHFPGHGWVNLDSHVACPVDERSLAEIQAKDMKPFSGLISQIDWMMPAHVVYEQVDSEPAGFSKTWLKDILKGELSFTGHIVSDDLSMAGAAIKGDYKGRSIAALEAGCDILLACNSSDASNEILASMAELSIEPMSLSHYKPDRALLNELKSEYQKAKAQLTELELLK